MQPCDSAAAMGGAVARSSDLARSSDPEDIQPGLNRRPRFGPGPGARGPGREACPRVRLASKTFESRVPLPGWLKWDRLDLCLCQIT